MTTAPPLTLYGIESTLVDLFLVRDSVLNDPDISPEDRQESVQAIDGEIVKYVRSEVAKVDRVAGCLREFETRAAALKAEAKRCTELAKLWEKRREDLENMVIGIMQQIGKTRFDGRHSVLNLRKNPPSVEVAQPELVPEDLLRREIVLTERVYQAILNGPMGALLLSGTTKAPEPMKAEILKKLKEGEAIAGCRLRTDGVRLEVK